MLRGFIQGYMPTLVMTLFMLLDPVLIACMSITVCVCVCGGGMYVYVCYSRLHAHAGSDAVHASRPHSHCVYVRQFFYDVVVSFT